MEYTHTNVVYVEVVNVLCSRDPASNVVCCTIWHVIRVPPFTTEPSGISPRQSSKQYIRISLEKNPMKYETTNSENFTSSICKKLTNTNIQGAAKKNVPRQKLRFLKNRSVNLHAIFTHCNEGTCTYLDNM